MNLYDFYKKPEDLKGQHEKDDLITNQLFDKIIKEYRRLRYQEDMNREDIVKYFETKFLSPTALRTLTRDPLLAFDFIEYVVSGPWKPGEDAIAKNINYSYQYATKILNFERFPKGEKIILTDPARAINYARYVIKGRWPELEKLLLSEHQSEILNYAENVMKDEWLKGEEAYLKWARNKFTIIIHLATSDLIYEYAVHVKKERWKEAEDIIRSNPPLWKKYKDLFHIEN